VDSIISLYRAEYLGRAVLPERQQKLYRQMQMLRRISEVYRVAVVITNQVNQTPDNYPLDLYSHKPLGGHVMALAVRRGYICECQVLSYGRTCS
jgi:DNA repair protein RadA